MAWYLKSYYCTDCDLNWTDEWSCACNDRCPDCDCETEPYEFADLSVLVFQEADKWRVAVSPESAEDSPRYAIAEFENQDSAAAYAADEIARLEGIANR